MIKSKKFGCRDIFRVLSLLSFLALTVYQIFLLVYYAQRPLYCLEFKSSQISQNGSAFTYDSGTSWQGAYYLNGSAQMIYDASPQFCNDSQIFQNVQFLFSNIEGDFDNYNALSKKHQFFQNHFCVSELFSYDSLLYENSLYYRTEYIQEGLLISAINSGGTLRTILQIFFFCIYLVLSIIFEVFNNKTTYRALLNKCIRRSQQKNDLQQMDSSDTAKDSQDLELSDTKRTDKWCQFSKTKIYETFLSIASICITYSLFTANYRGCLKSSIPIVLNQFKIFLTISGVALAFPLILVGYSITKIYQKKGIKLSTKIFWKILNIWIQILGFLDALVLLLAIALLYYYAYAQTFAYFASLLLGFNLINALVNSCKFII